MFGRTKVSVALTPTGSMSVWLLEIMTLLVDTGRCVAVSYKSHTMVLAHDAAQTLGNAHGNFARGIGRRNYKHCIWS